MHQLAGLFVRRQGGAAVPAPSDTPWWPCSDGDTIGAGECNDWDRSQSEANPLFKGRDSDRLRTSMCLEPIC